MKIVIEVVGTSPLLMHNPRMVCDIADTIIETALRLKIYSIIQMGEE